MSTPASRVRETFKGIGPALKIVAVIAVAITVVWLAVGWYKGTEHDVVATVDSKERVCESSSDGQQKCEFRVFTDNGSFKVADSLLYTRWNSSDVYGQIHEHKRYRFHVVGVRFGFTSSYENILTAEEVPS